MHSQPSLTACILKGVHFFPPLVVAERWTERGRERGSQRLLFRRSGGSSVQLLRFARLTMLSSSSAPPADIQPQSRVAFINHLHIMDIVLCLSLLSPCPVCPSAPLHPLPPPLPQPSRKHLLISILALHSRLISSCLQASACRADSRRSICNSLDTKISIRCREKRKRSAVFTLICTRALFPHPPSFIPLF